MNFFPYSIAGKQSNKYSSIFIFIFTTSTRTTLYIISKNIIISAFPLSTSLPSDQKQMQQDLTQ